MLLLEEESGDFDICRHRWVLNVGKDSMWSDHAKKLVDEALMHTCLTWCASVSQRDDLHKRCPRRQVCSLWTEHEERLGSARQTASQTWTQHSDTEANICQVANEERVERLFAATRGLAQCRHVQYTSLDADRVSDF